MRVFLPLLLVSMALSSMTAFASPGEIVDTSAKLLVMQARIEQLEWQVLSLGSALFLLLALLGFWQFYRRRRLRILSMTDELTKLPNRQHILTFLSDQARFSYQEEQPISVIMFEIDHFKKIIDTYGRESGDGALKSLASLANQALRRGDRVGRSGSEEFLAVLPGTERRSAVEIAERMRRSVESSEHDKLLSTLQMTISLGVAEWNAGKENIDTLVKRARLALHEAKENGRNCVVEK